MKNPLEYVRPNILALEPYSTARDEFEGGDIDIWLDANESPYDNGVNRYPDPRHKILKKRISELKNVPKESIFIGGAGSDEAIDLTYRIFCEPAKHKALILQPTYGVYAVAAQINNVGIVELPLGEDFSLPVQKIIETTENDKTIKLVWICSPNNPTGNAFDLDDILLIADRFDGIVAVDEAYVDFSTKGSLLSFISDHSNLIVLQTFSKAWGMAGLRCGMAFCMPELAAIYNNVKYPYNINGPTQHTVFEMTRKQPLEEINEIIEERKKLDSAFQKIGFVKKVYHSDANFLLVEVEKPNSLYQYLIGKGVIVRNRSKVPGCGTSLRFTVGTPGENKRIIELMKQFEISGK